MKSVGLASCDLGADGAKAVADYVSSSAVLTECSLLKNDLDIESAKMLGTRHRPQAAGSEHRHWA